MAQLPSQISWLRPERGTKLGAWAPLPQRKTANDIVIGQKRIDSGRFPKHQTTEAQE